MSRKAVVEIKNMSKRFGSTIALNHVDITVYSGEICGLIGENGSGKSTATSIYAGMQKCDEGEMFLEGTPWKPASMMDALEHGVGMIVQENGTVPGITVAENIFLGKSHLFKKGPFVNGKEMIRQAQEALNGIGANHIKADMVTAALDFQDRKLVEIAKVMVKNPKVLVVDETTTALSQLGRKIIYDIMNKMRDEGKTVIFISHDLDEIMEVCGRLTVLRDGNIIRTFEKDEFEENAIKASMIGREMKGDYYRGDYDGSFSEEVVAELKDANLGNQLINFNLQLHKGEILGIGGLSHCGMHTLGKVVFVYVSDGTKEVVWPHFTYFGFRYVRVSGWIEELRAEDFTAKVVYSDLDRTGFFECSNEKINRLYENSFWGQCSNFTDIPTDCPQRDERMGWTGDTQAFAPTACYHMDTRIFYRKFLHDLRNEQIKLNGGIPNYFPNQGNLGGCCAVWGDCGTFVPDTLRKFYGNKTDYETEYEMMSDWVDYVTRECADESHLIKKQHQFGDWLALDGVTNQSMRGGTDEEYIAAVYYYASAKMTADMGKEIGACDWKQYELLAEMIKAAVLKEYFSETGRLVVDTQTGYLVALRFGIYKDREKILEGLKKRLRLDAYQLKCGFVGAPVLCQTLADNYLKEYAYEFLLKEDFPSWLYCVNLGATTIWERWNSVEADGKISRTGMNSLNHYAYGNVAEFLYGNVAGIRSAGHGFKKAVIAPEITGRFAYVNASYKSVNGNYVCNWKIEDDGKLNIHVEVPFECQAVLRLPEREEEVLKTGSYDIFYMPSKDFRCIYGENSLLGDLVKDSQAVEILSKYVPQGIGLGNGDAEGRTIRMKELKEMFYMGVNPVSCQTAIEELEKLIVRV